MIKFEPSPKITRKNWTWSTRRKKQKNQDIKKLKFYWINGGHQCGNCRGFHWHIRSSKNVYIMSIWMLFVLSIFLLSYCLIVIQTQTVYVNNKS